MNLDVKIPAHPSGWRTWSRIHLAACGRTWLQTCRFQCFLLWSFYVARSPNGSTKWWRSQIHEGKLKRDWSPFMNGKISQCRGLDNSFINDLVVSEEPLWAQIRNSWYSWQGRRGFVASLLTHIPLLYMCFVTSSRNYLQSLGTYLIKPKNSTAY